MKNYLKHAKHYFSNKYAQAGVGVTGLFMSASSFAAIDQTAVDAQYAAITADIDYLEGKSWPLVFLITGIVISIGLFKRFTRTATS